MVHARIDHAHKQIEPRPPAALQTVLKLKQGAFRRGRLRGGPVSYAGAHRLMRDAPPATMGCTAAQKSK